MSYKLLPALAGLAALALVVSAPASAQTYNVQVTSAPYQNLEPVQAIGKGTSMAEGYSLTAPFTFRPYDTLFNFSTSSILFARNGYVGVDDKEVFWAMDACLTNLVPIDSTSHMGVQLTGTMMGSRTMKFEWKNLRPAQNPAGDYINFQLWLYEADNTVEVHIGPSHLTQRTTWNDSGPSIGMFLSSYSLGTFYHQIYLCGDAAQPSPSYVYDDVLKPLNNVPVEGTVYRFSMKKQGAGVERLDAADAISFHPNPTGGASRLALPAELRGRSATLRLFDMLGREALVIDDARDGVEIPSDRLAPGVYNGVLSAGEKRYDAGRLIVR